MSGLCTKLPSHKDAVLNISIKCRAGKFKKKILTYSFTACSYVPIGRVSCYLSAVKSESYSNNPKFCVERPDKASVHRLILFRLYCFLVQCTWEWDLLRAVNEQSPGFPLTARGDRRIRDCSRIKFFYVRMLWDLFKAFHFFFSSLSAQNVLSAKPFHNFSKLHNKLDRFAYNFVIF
jgi:hypothetical protein